MGWREVDGQGAPKEQTQAEDQKRKDADRALRQAAVAALAKTEQKPLREYLRRVAMASSYAPGRAHADMSYAEGQRALAAKLLDLGGCNE